MNIVLYTSSSFGGCYDYAQQLHAAYNAHTGVDRCLALYPENANLPHRADVLPILMPDQRPGAAEPEKRMMFLQRNVRNPLRLMRFLQRQTEPQLVIFNDFEQITAPFWVPLFKRAFSGRHRFAIVLHDPDRDAYPPSPKASAWCMKTLMGLMDLGLYHDVLPDKPYYKPNGLTRYMAVPHGLYPVAPPAEVMQAYLQESLQPGLRYAAILGNIREEKNYPLAIEALTRFPQLGLIIAGAPSSSTVDVPLYKRLAKRMGVEDRIVWIEKFLTDAEMAAVIEAAEFILLYYAKSFTSQSGVLNTAAPFRKTIIASDGESSLAHTLRQHSIGLLAAPDDIEALSLAIGRALDGFGPDPGDWGHYLEQASWQAQADLVVNEAAGLFGR